MKIKFAPPEGFVWWNCFTFPGLRHICSVTGTPDNPPDYDPRIGGNGEIVWQLAD